MANLGDLSGFGSYGEWQAANRAEGGSGVSADVKAYFDQRDAGAAAPDSGHERPGRDDGGAGGAGSGGGGGGGGGGAGAGSDPYANLNLSSDAANKALKDAGGPGKVGLPANPNQAQIDAWFREAVKAGGYTERGENTSSTAYQSSGYNSGPDSTGLRARARAGGWSEDFDRWSESQLIAWSKQIDPGCPPNDPFRGRDGSCVQKPIDSNGSMMPNGQANPNWNQGGPVDGGGGGGGRGGGGGGYAPVEPPKPTTFGNQLSMTGNPLQDMLIQQFNTGMDPNTFQSNIFALGEDMRVGGTGINADAQKSDRQAQSLSGGGIWWGQNKDTFGGFDASVKNASGPETVSPGYRAPAATEAAPAPRPQGPGAPGINPAVLSSSLAPTSRMGGMYTARRKPQLNMNQQTPITGMVQGQYNSPARNRPSYF